MHSLERFFSQHFTNFDMLQLKLIDTLFSSKDHRLGTDPVVNVDDITHYKLDALLVNRLHLSGFYDLLVTQQDHIVRCFIVFKPVESEAMSIRDAVIRTLGGNCDQLVAQYERPISQRFKFSELLKDYDNSLYSSLNLKTGDEDDGIYNILSTDTDEQVLVLASNSSDVSVEILSPIRFEGICSTAQGL